MHLHLRECKIDFLKPGGLTHFLVADWTTRVKQIAKLWRKASSQERAPYVVRTITPAFTYIQQTYISFIRFSFVGLLVLGWIFFNKLGFRVCESSLTPRMPL